MSEQNITVEGTTVVFEPGAIIGHKDHGDKYQWRVLERSPNTRNSFTYLVESAAGPLHAVSMMNYGVKPEPFPCEIVCLFDLERWAVLLRQEAPPTTIPRMPPPETSERRRWV